MEAYNHRDIEEKWHKVWKENRIFQAVDHSSGPKYYPLVEFPYPSGDGLHMGHLRSYTAMDVIARKKRMEGYNVLFPIGFDAFGLPAENYAIKTGVHPKITTEKNIGNFVRQLKSLGYSFDWDRVVNTTDPSYYKWTQWIFLKFFEKSLAYKIEAPTNWCTSCKVTLAHEEVVNGKCERCGSEVEIRLKKQWLLRITAYADRLIEDLAGVNYLDIIKEQQKNWIGKSEGAEILFSIKGMEADIAVFTTRADTLYGATYLVLAPEHPLIGKIVSDEQRKECEAYIAEAHRRSERERQEDVSSKTGIFTGAFALHPLTGKEIPIWISDYVLASYGTGAVMAVPAHDRRDADFAKKLDLLSLAVIQPNAAMSDIDCFESDGTVMNSGEFDGLSSADARGKIVEKLTRLGRGRETISYKLHDWVFSRQRYWGEPIPMIECPHCQYVPVPYEELPVVLPPLPDYQPTATGESPLANIPEWVNVKCPSCGTDAKRETDTMPQWAGSSWYFLRYCDPSNSDALADQEKLSYWMPVDWYNGGAEHITLHLLYSRFWNKFLYDIGVVPKSEPYTKRTLQGMILGEGGVKMSKSKGNVVSPDQYVKDFGADATRLYILFMGPFDQAIAWDHQGVVGVRRFLERVWQLSERVVDEESGKMSEHGLRMLHKTIKKVGEDIETMRFNTAVAAFMILLNVWSKEEGIFRKAFEDFLAVFSPFAPHLASELWLRLQHDSDRKQDTWSGFISEWPSYDPSLVEDEMLEIVISVNGKVRDHITVARDTSEDEVRNIAVGREKIQRWLGDKKIEKFIYVPDKLINIVLQEAL
jgi:leucyl-tRNA synthetase